MSSKILLKSFIATVIEEGRMREADVSDGTKVPWGSKQHVLDLQKRITDLTAWRNRQKKGTEARANYSRLISRLKGELNSAKRTIAKKSK